MTESTLGPLARMQKDLQAFEAALAAGKDPDNLRGLPFKAKDVFEAFSTTADILKRFGGMFDRALDRIETLETENANLKRQIARLKPKKRA